MSKGFLVEKIGSAERFVCRDVTLYQKCNTKVSRGRTNSAYFFGCIKCFETFTLEYKVKGSLLLCTADKCVHRSRIILNIPSEKKSSVFMHILSLHQDRFPSWIQHQSCQGKPQQRCWTFSFYLSIELHHKHPSLFLQQYWVLRDTSIHSYPQPLSMFFKETKLSFSGKIRQLGEFPGMSNFIKSDLRLPFVD